MNAQAGENNVTLRAALLRTRQNNDFILGVESQTLPFILGFDVKQSDGVEDFYTGMSDARTERAA